MTQGSVAGLHLVQLRYTIHILLCSSASFLTSHFQLPVATRGSVGQFPISQKQFDAIGTHPVDVQSFFLLPCLWMQALVVLLLGGTQMAHRAIV
jgi:hypothetical protein